MRFDPPVFVTVSERELLLPTITLPKLRFAGLGDRVPADMPVPDKPNVSVESAAFEMMVTVPVALPGA